MSGSSEEHAVTPALTADPAAVRTADPHGEEQRLRELQRAVARDPADPEKWFRLALFATIVGAYSDAMEAFHGALARRSEQVDYFWLYMGIAAAKTGRHEDALLASSKVTEAAHDDPSAWVLKAMALENLGRLDERRDALERACALEPMDANQMVMVGYALGGLERYTEALAMDERATDADPANAMAWANKGAHLAKCGEEHAEGAVDAFENALERALHDGKILPTILRNYGIALVELGREADALPVLVRARKLDPNDFTIWRSLGTVYTRLGDHEAALEHDKQAVYLAPHHPIAWRSMGVDLFALERYEEALYSFTRAAELAPEHAQMWHAKGMALWRLGRFVEALSAFDQVTGLDDRYADGWLAKGACLDAVARHDEAVEALRRAVGLGLVGAGPERPELWALLGAAYGHVDDARAAEHAFRAGYRVDPSEAMASGLIDALARQHREREALDFLGGAKPRGADDGLVAYWRAILRGRAGEDDLAVDELRRAVRAWSTRGMHHQRAAAATRALDAFESARRSASAWNDYWFGGPRASLTTALGSLLLIALLVVVALPLVHPDSAKGAERWAAITMAAAVLLVLLALPTVRKIKAGSGSFEIETIVLVEREHRELALPTEIGITKIPELPGLAPTTLPGFADFTERLFEQLLHSTDVDVPAVAAHDGPDGRA
jgi:tetratricopeptide (TPR) repeat protein